MKENCLALFCFNLNLNEKKERKIGESKKPIP